MVRVKFFPKKIQNFEIFLKCPLAKQPKFELPAQIGLIIFDKTCLGICILLTVALKCNSIITFQIRIKMTYLAPSLKNSQNGPYNMDHIIWTISYGIPKSFFILFRKKLEQEIILLEKSLNPTNE